MSHSAGLSGMDEPMTPEDMYDWDKVLNALARQQPWWEPGTQSGYHAITQGHLIGEVIRRITGQSIGAFFCTEIAEPAGAESAFTDRLLPGEKAGRNPNHHWAILALTTAFRDAWVVGNGQAKVWLEGLGPAAVLEWADRWSRK